MEFYIDFEKKRQPHLQVDQFPFLGEDCKSGVKGEEEWGPSPQVRNVKTI